VLRKIFKEFKRIVLSPFIHIFTFATRVIVRFFIIRKYFLENDSRKLHLGAGSSVNLGWLTSDLSPKITGRTIYIDATKKLPFKDNSFDFVYCEHMIEHISYDQASRMLEECNRVMKKGAKIRISTPDLDKYLSLFESNISSIQEDFIVFMRSNWLSRFKFDNDKDLPHHILNLNMHAWGHQYIYCYSTLSEQLIKKGFVSLERYDNDCSNNRTLSKLEKHAYTLEKRGIKDAARMVNFETMNVEATKQ
jgi:predicted SAM-dependent methyltransferase